MRPSSLSVQPARSLHPAPARGGRGSTWRRIVTAIRGGIRGVYWLVLVTAMVGCSELAAETAIPATPSRLAGDGLRPMEDLSVDIQPESGDLPGDPAAAKFAAAGQVQHMAGTSRPWPLYSYWWEAPAVCHRPLYFEEVNLERYGYSCGVAQPVVSAAHFFGTIPALPYLMAAEPCSRCVYTLGHYRPGSCAPLQIVRPPLSLRGAAAEAGVVTGLIFAIP